MLAIHTKGASFAAGWVEYCNINSIPFKEVDCFSSDIMNDLDGCSALLWHWSHIDYLAHLFARQLIASVEARGVLVFPSTATCWHYDDKVGQKYLLDSIGAPAVPSHVFYDRDRALSWLQQAAFPLVWKLRGGAGSQNVRLVRNFDAAQAIVRRSFGRGWRSSRFHALREKIWHFRRQPGLNNFSNIGRGLARVIVPHEIHRQQQAERNYVYFQDFVPENDHDIRVIVIGERAIAIKRMIRDGDFRASGSGLILHAKGEIPEECLRIAFDVTEKIDSQCCAFDFVRDGSRWSIIEISYAFSLAGYVDCPGFWKADLSWHPGAVRPEHFMIEDVVSRLNAKNILPR
ncbi:hypothetical protein KK137_04390 [Croceibacterium sp. LX-88]|uniref:ATP-grasp domain-containing protein n=1 Tax=Croceibacterium selenioxidans TaxID=2838833 RepID=A0ABS5W1D4_9SPHN|nr:hypothetical protein [Croceibacterium selenioxidans]MBT2133568.1 hypothetical protein [Croceibacterium selenioxidans]